MLLPKVITRREQMTSLVAQLPTSVQVQNLKNEIKRIDQQPHWYPMGSDQFKVTGICAGFALGLIYFADHFYSPGSNLKMCAFTILGGCFGKLLDTVYDRVTKNQEDQNRRNYYSYHEMKSLAEKAIKMIKVD